MTNTCWRIFAHRLELYMMTNHASHWTHRTRCWITWLIHIYKRARFPRTLLGFPVHARFRVLCLCRFLFLVRRVFFWLCPFPLLHFFFLPDGWKSCHGGLHWLLVLCLCFVWLVLYRLTYFCFITQRISFTVGAFLKNLFFKSSECKLFHIIFFNLFVTAGGGT